MDKYYERDGITIYLGSFLDLIDQIPNAIADVVVADPPYGDTSLAWDRPVPWAALVRPKLNAQGSLWCFGSMRYLLAHHFAGWKFAQDLVWEKHNGSNFHNDRFRRVHEHLIHLYPGDRPWRAIYKHPVTTNDATARTVRRKQRPPHLGQIERGDYTSHDGGPRLMRSVIKARSCHGYAVHPTQKPLEIVRPLLHYSSPPGGLVLDPFMGSGTTLVAARELGMKAIGIEVSEAYCQAAVERLR